MTNEKIGEGSGTTVGAGGVSPLTVGDTIYDEGLGDVEPLSTNKQKYSNSSHLYNPHLNTLTLKKDDESSSQSRNYKCPSCGGEFNNWRKKYKNSRGDWVDDQYIVGSTTNTDKRSFCPFCDIKRGEYNNE